MHFQRYKVQNSIDEKDSKKKKQRATDYYLKFLTKYTEILLDENSTNKSKIFAIEMLGGFINNKYIKDTLELAKNTYKNNTLILEAVSSALSGAYFESKEDSYENYIIESGIQDEIKKAIQDEENRAKEEYRNQANEGKEMSRYRVALENVLKRSL